MRRNGTTVIGAGCLATLGLLAAGACAAGSARAASLIGYAGGKLVYSSRADGDAEIYTIEPDGSGRTQLTFNGAADTAPVWSPDGKRIAFASDRAGNWDIFVMQSDGSSVVNLTGDSSAAETAPTWSPDGHRVAYTSDRTGTKQIFVQDLLQILGGGPTQLTYSGRNEDPSWGIAGGVERIFFTSNRDGDDEIYSMLPTGLGLIQLTSNRRRDRHPRYSRSGHVYYETNEGGDFEIYRMRPDGTQVEAITQNGKQDLQPTGSPDGESVAYIRGKGRRGDLFVADVGGGVVRLTNDKVADELPDWQAIRLPSLSLPAIFDVAVVPHGLEMEVRFKTSKTVTRPVVEVFRGAQLESFQLGTGSGTSWAITVGALDAATPYRVQIAVSTAPGEFVYYEVPYEVSTLRRKVTFTARYAFVLNDSDPASCGDITLGMKLVDLPQYGRGIASGQENACSGYTWNFPNKSFSVDDVTSDTLTIRFTASDDDTPLDSFEIVTGDATVSLVDYPESFTRTVKAKLDVPDPNHPGDLYLDVTFDYKVQYHP